jgi:hypothetical protein
VLFGLFFSWFGFALVYGRINDIGNTYLSILGLAAPLLLLPAFALLDARLHGGSWAESNPGKYLGLAWVFGAIAYFPFLLIVVGTMRALS